MMSSLAPDEFDRQRNILPIFLILVQRRYVMTDSAMANVESISAALPADVLSAITAARSVTTIFSINPAIPSMAKFSKSMN